MQNSRLQKNSAVVFLVLIGTLTPSLARGEVVELAARLTTACSGVPTTGEGSAFLRLDTETGIMSYDVPFTVQGGFMFAHIHGPIENGCGTGGAGAFLYQFFEFIGSTADQLTLSTEQIRELIDGQYYINIHTNLAQGGEISGHIGLMPKSRYLTWHPLLVDDVRLAPGSAAGLRVTVISLPTFPEIEGTQLWIGPPSDQPEEDSSNPGRTFSAARLQCTPHIEDWSGYGSVHVTAGEIIPGSAYRIELYDPTCGDVKNPACFYGARDVVTSQFGDVTVPFAAGFSALQPDFRDISAQVKKFLGDPTGPIKAAAQLVPNTPDASLALGFKTISATVQAFLGASYVDQSGISGACLCPSTVICGTTCLSNAACGTGLCLEGTCTDQCGRCEAMP